MHTLYPHMTTVTVIISLVILLVCLSGLTPLILALSGSPHAHVASGVLGYAFPLGVFLFHLIYQCVTSALT